jgi:hypothetical protein
MPRVIVVCDDKGGEVHGSSSCAYISTNAIPSKERIVIRISTEMRSRVGDRCWLRFSEGFQLRKERPREPEGAQGASG